MMTTSVNKATKTWLTVAAVAGGLHAAITFHWALGGQHLLWTMGTAFIAKFATVMWILWPLGLVKAGVAFGPLWLASRGWPWAHLTRALCWIAGAILTGWGGANTLATNAVLFGLYRPAGGYDRNVMIGHAWMWDPLFVVWGVGIIGGLLTSRRSRAVRA